MQALRLSLSGSVLYQNQQALTTHQRISVAANGVSAARGRRPARALQLTRHWLMMLVVSRDWLRAIRRVTPVAIILTMHLVIFNQTCAWLCGREV